MARLKSQGGISPEMMEQAKAAMLEENADYSEAQEPSKRSGAGYPSLGGFIEQHFDFKQCQRTDGSIYGVKDSSDCAQKGSKEVKKNKGGEGGGQGNSSQLAGMSSAKQDKKLSTLGTHALRDQMSLAASSIDDGHGSKTGGATANSKKTGQEVVIKAYDQYAKLKRQEGKPVPTLTSIVPADKLRKLGIDPDKANALAKQGKSIKGAATGAKAAPEKKGGARTPEHEANYKLAKKKIEKDLTKANKELEQASKRLKGNPKASLYAKEVKEAQEKVNAYKAGLQRSAKDPEIAAGWAGSAKREQKQRDDISRDEREKRQDAINRNVDNANRKAQRKKADDLEKKQRAKAKKEQDEKDRVAKRAKAYADRAKEAGA